MHPAGDTTHSSSAHQAVQRQVYSRTSAQRPCAAQLLRRGGWLLSLQAMQAEQGEPRGEPGAGDGVPWALDVPYRVAQGPPSTSMTCIVSPILQRCHLLLWLLLHFHVFAFQGKDFWYRTSNCAGRREGPHATGRGLQASKQASKEASKEASKQASTRGAKGRPLCKGQSAISRFRPTPIPTNVT
eukprot:1160653-Pelagomonas_calceolata.AAC.2